MKIISKEDVLQKQARSFQNGVPYFDVEDIYKAMELYASQFADTHQTLLDEVNRLNAELERYNNGASRFDY